VLPLRCPYAAPPSTPPTPPLPPLQVLLKEDIGLNTAEVRKIVQAEVEAYRGVGRAEEVVDQRIGKVHEKAGARRREADGEPQHGAGPAAGC